MSILYLGYHETFHKQQKQISDHDVLQFFALSPGLRHFRRSNASKNATRKKAQDGKLSLCTTAPFSKLISCNYLLQCSFEHHIHMFLLSHLLSIPVVRPL